MQYSRPGGSNHDSDDSFLKVAIQVHKAGHVRLRVERRRIRLNGRLDGGICMQEWKHQPREQKDYRLTHLCRLAYMEATGVVAFESCKDSKP